LHGTKCRLPGAPMIAVDSFLRIETHRSGIEWLNSVQVNLLPNNYLKKKGFTQFRCDLQEGLLENRLLRYLPSDKAAIHWHFVLRISISQNFK
jgi:hypothetical protein